MCESSESIILLGARQNWILPFYFGRGDAGVCDMLQQLKIPIETCNTVGGVVGNCDGADGGVARMKGARRRDRKLERQLLLQVNS